MLLSWSKRRVALAADDLLVVYFSLSVLQCATPRSRADQRDAARQDRSMAGQLIGLFLSFGALQVAVWTTCVCVDLNFNSNSYSRPN